MALPINRSYFEQATLKITQSLPQSMMDRTKYEQITPCEIDDLLEKMNEFSSKLSPNERQAVDQDLAVPRFMLQSCREMIHRFESQRLTQALLQKKVNISTLNLAYDSKKFSLHCPALSRMRLPITGFYRQKEYALQSHIFLMKIHALFLTQVPAPVANILKDKKNFQCDFTLDVSSAFPMEQAARAERKDLRYNLITHPWALPRAQNGQDSKKFPQMGIFEPLGVAQVPGDDGVAFNSLKRMEVYIHPSGGGMAISPNNAHFNVIEGSPFSAFWHVAVCDERILVANQWLINDPNHPFSKLINKSLHWKTSTCIKDHLHILESEKAETIRQATERLENVAKAFEESRPNAFSLFDTLTLGEKNRVLYLTWVQMGKKIGIHNDFGRASFFGAQDLNREYRCSPSQRASVIRTLLRDQVADFEKLIEGQRALFSAPTDYPYLPPERLRKEKMLRPILEKFKAEDFKEAMNLFLALPGSDKEKVFEITWELKGCPIHSNFGNLSFLRSENLSQIYHCTDSERMDVITLYLNQ